MSLSDRRTFVGKLALSVLALGTISACQFQPALSRSGPAGALIGQVEIMAPKTTQDYLMTQTLETRLGRAGAEAPYVLDYEIEIDRVNLGKDRDGSTQRVHTTGVASYTLKRRGEAGSVAQGKVRNFTGYSTTGNTVTTSAARRDATERLIEILADDMVARLLLASPDLSL